MEYRMRCASTGAPILWLLRVCKIPGSVWPANTKPALWMMWWPHFLRISATILHPAPGPQNLNFGCQGHPQTPSFEVRSSLTQQCCCTPPQWENTTFYPLLHRNHPTYTNSLCESPSSPQRMPSLNEFLIPKCPVPGQPLTPESAHPHTHPRRSFTP